MAEILVVQDSPSVNMMLKVRLQAGGFEPDIAVTGTEGLDKAKEKKYDLILLDYTLPDIDGGDVCKKLRAQDNSKETHILFLSAKDPEMLQRLVEETGADGYIGLPFEGQELLDRINEVINKE